MTTRQRLEIEGPLLFDTVTVLFGLIDIANGHYEPIPETSPVSFAFLILIWLWHVRALWVIATLEK